jgi:hypothetical protein
MSEKTNQEKDKTFMEDSDSDETSSNSSIISDLEDPTDEDEESSLKDLDIDDQKLLEKLMTKTEKKLQLTEKAFSEDEEDDDDDLDDDDDVDPNESLNPLDGVPIPDFKKLKARMTRGRAKMVQKIKVGLDTKRHNREVMQKLRSKAPKEPLEPEPIYDEDNIDEIEYTREESLKSAWKDLYVSCPLDTKAFVVCNDAIGLQNCERSLMSLSQCAAIEHCFHGWQSMIENCSGGWSQNYAFHCQDAKAAVFACFSEYGFPEVLQRAVMHHVQVDPTGARRSQAIEQGYTPEEIDSEEPWEGPGDDQTEDVSELLREMEEEKRASANRHKDDEDSLD